MNRLAKVFENPHLEWLVERLVRRYEQGKPFGSGSISLAEPSSEQRRAVDDLLGRRSSSGRSLSVPLVRLGTPEEIIAGLEAIRGELQDLSAQRAERAGEWERFFKRWQALSSDHEVLSACVEKFTRSGMLKRCSSSQIPMAEKLLGQLATIVRGIPHDGILLASLAAKVSGDSHALDRGQPLAAMCLQAIRELEGIDGSSSAEKRRAAWDSIGVTVDDLSSPILCLNLPALAGSDLAPWIDWHVARGEPFYLTFRQLRKFQPDPGSPEVFVCENPAIVSEAARRLGSASHALVCLNGLPNSAVKTLLRQISDQHIPLRLRADFDWAGLTFINQLLSLESASLWRMSAADYEACASPQPLRGEVFAPGWARELAEAMLLRGTAAYEEELLESLIGDLDRSDQSPND